MTPENFISYIHKELGLLPMVAPYAQRIGRHLVVGVDQLASPDTGEVLVLPPLSSLFDETREYLGEPIPVTAGYRTHRHELRLQNLGYKTAKFVSPHSFCALDLDARPTKGRTEKQVCLEIVQATVAAAQKLGLPRPRMGYRGYDYRFVHVDLTFYLFKPYTNLEHPQHWPNLTQEQRQMLSAWRPGAEW